MLLYHFLYHSLRRYRVVFTSDTAVLICEPTLQANSIENFFFSASAVSPETVRNVSHLANVIFHFASTWQALGKHLAQTWHRLGTPSLAPQPQHPNPPQNPPSSPTDQRTLSRCTHTSTNKKMKVTIFVLLAGHPHRDLIQIARILGKMGMSINTYSGHLAQIGIQRSGEPFRVYDFHRVQSVHSKRKWNET